MEQNVLKTGGSGGSNLKYRNKICGCEVPLFYISYEWTMFESFTEKAPFEIKKNEFRIL